MTKLLRGAVLTAILGVAPTFAAIVFDQGPTTGDLYESRWSNQSNGQNFADNVTLLADTEITGMSIFTGGEPGANFDFHFRMLSDNAGIPDAVLNEFTVAGIYSLYGNVNGTDLYQIDISFSPIFLQGGVTYWFGLSGNEFDANQASLSSGPGDGLTAQFSGSDYTNMTPIGDQMFQLSGGDVSAVPEPGSMVLASAGLAMVAYFTKRHRRA